VAVSALYTGGTVKHQDSESPVPPMHSALRASLSPADRRCLARFCYCRGTPCQRHGHPTHIASPSQSPAMRHSTGCFTAISAPSLYPDSPHNHPNACTHPPLNPPQTCQHTHMPICTNLPAVCLKIQSQQYHLCTVHSGPALPLPISSVWPGSATAVAHLAGDMHFPHTSQRPASCLP
jgi:hypothetical protein